MPGAMGSPQMNGTTRIITPLVTLALLLASCTTAREAEEELIESPPRSFVSTPAPAEPTSDAATQETATDTPVAPTETPVPAPTATPIPPTAVPATATPSRDGCSPAYPTVCIPQPPPDLDCGQVSARRFRVLAPDPHGFDNDGDGVGCES